MKILVVSLLFAVLAPAAEPDPCLGRWKMDLSKTKYDPGPLPKGIECRYQDAGSGANRFEATVRQASGRTFTMTWTARYDGKDYPVKGSPIYDTIVHRRIDRRTVHFTLKKDGKPVSQGRRVLSEDGNTYFNYADGVNEDGTPFHNVGVYVRER